MQEMLSIDGKQDVLRSVYIYIYYTVIDGAWHGRVAERTWVGGGISPRRWLGGSRFMEQDVLRWFHMIYIVSSIVLGIDV